MISRNRMWVAALLLLALPLKTGAQDVLIRGATVHTAGPQGSLENTDVLVRKGLVHAIGKSIVAPASVPVVEAKGRPLTPTLFGGIAGIGVTELPEEATTEDAAFVPRNASDMEALRPEFDVSLAYNPNSILIPLARVEGIGFHLLSADSEQGGSIVGGQGAVMRLDGSHKPLGQKVLFVTLGGKVSSLSGASRAGQWMLLEQLVTEVKSGNERDGVIQLTSAGRSTLQKFIAGRGLIVFRVDRAADIRQLLEWSARHKLSIAIASGVEAWQLADEIASAGVPVFVDPLVNLPFNFDQLGARSDNAALLRAAGVKVGFTQSFDAAQNARNARKLRQLAGNAVAEGLPWGDGLAGLTRVPAETFGVADKIGTIEPGRQADLVLWTGDPLDVVNTAVQVWMQGRAISMCSRQTELRDRYLPKPASARVDSLSTAYPLLIPSSCTY